MLRIKLSKLKQVCATALIPNIIKETKTLKKDIDKCSIGYLNKSAHKKYKSTDTGSKDENNNKRKAIIEKCFSEPTLLHMKDNEKGEPTAPLVKPTTKDNNKSLISRIFGNAKIEQNQNEETLRNAKIQAVVAKIEEVKQAHDTIRRDEILNVGSAGAKEKTTTVKAQNLAQDTVKIDRTPSMEIDGIKEVHAPKASALLQHTNVQTTTGNIQDDEKTSHTGDLNAQEVSETLKKAEHLANAAKVEKEQLAQTIVHIDNTPHFDIGVTEVKDPNDPLSVSEALQKDEDDEARREKEKIAQHTVNIETTPLVEPVAIESPEPSELKESVKVQATTAKIEEEKLAQKIDQIDETPHVEAGVDKIEGFNVSPKILGHDTTPNLSISEPVPESDQPEQVNLEELAKKCLGKLDGDVDQILLKEMKNLSNVNSLKFDLPKDDSSQKYFSQIFQNETKKNDKIVFDISDNHLKHFLSNEMKNLSDNEMRFDNFQPFHLDTVPLITTDTREYKDEYNKKYSPDVKNLLLDIPAVLDPYDMQAIPFYQYVSKDNIVLQELQLEEGPIQKSSTAESVQRPDINAPMNEEVILKREEETESVQELAVNNELKDMEQGETEDRKVTTANTVEPLTEVDSCSKSPETPTMSESDVSKLLEYKNVLTASEFSTTETGKQPAQSLPSTMEEYPLETQTQTVLTTPVPTDDFGNPIMQRDDGHTKSEEDKQSYETRTDTAISANQDPEEYFPTNHFNTFTGVSIEQVEYPVTDSVVKYTGVFDSSKNMYDEPTDEPSTDNLISQNISHFSTFPQLSEFLENPKDVLNTSKVDLADNERITHVLLQPDSKREDIRVQCVQPDRKEFRKEIVQEPRREEKTKASIIKVGDTSSILDESLPLSVLLRRIRQRNRMESLKSVKAEVEAKKPNCLPPLDKSKPRTELRPSPCKPKPKETDNKCKDPNPCKPPEKKDPCAKFIPFLLHTIYRSNFDVSLPHHTRYEQMYTYISLAKEIAFNKLKQLGHFLGILNIKYRGEEVDEVVCARDFEPWVPIPSWPLPKVEKRRPFVCPKEGCKLPVHPIRSNTDKPCLGMPKKVSPSKTVKISAQRINEIYI